MATQAPSLDDSISSRISTCCPPATQQILTAAWAHDLPALKRLLDEPGKASVQDPQTRETPLHAAVRSCGPAAGVDDSQDVEGDGGDHSDDAATIEAAKAAVHELFLSGAIWNDVDDRDETPGCVAWRLGRRQLYDLCVEAGVRAELLFGLLDGYEELESGSGDLDLQEWAEEEGADHVEIEMENGPGNGAEGIEDGDEAPALVEEVKLAAPAAADGPPEAPEAAEPPSSPPRRAGSTVVDIRSEDYLRSKLTYLDGKLVDDDRNGVMMAWETDIMRRSVDALLPEGGQRPRTGRRILNIGFGMGIIDGMFADTQPARHHIVEAHPEVLQRIDAAPDSRFGTAWEAAGPEPGAYRVHRGRWQDICPKLLEAGEVYDAIYFDTFGEDYGQLRKFFTEFVVGLLDQDGVFSFFNGLGADRRICYDVYTKVVEMHLTDAGLDVEWKVVDVDLKGLEEEGKGEWEGVRRRYWTLDKYRLPVCTFLG